MKQVSKKKILFYNWIQFDCKYGHGGGVNVYQDNLIKSLSNNPNYDVYFLSSGTSYTLKNKDPFVRKTKNKYGDNCHSFELVNSPCPAPMSIMYDSLDLFCSDNSCYDTLVKFISSIGGVDIIHFNNIEGLSAKCLEIKNAFPKTKVFFSMHNYSIVFPNVYLLFNKKGNKYLLDYKGSRSHAIRFYKIKSACRKVGVPGLSEKIRDLYSFSKKLTNKGNNNSNDEEFSIPESTVLKYQKAIIDRINNNVNLVFAVSNRTRDIGLEYGIHKDKIVTEYIGVNFKQTFKNLRTDGDYLNICFMGYANEMKGFKFFLDSANRMPEKIAKRLNVYCYARADKPEEKQFVSDFLKLKDRFHLVEYQNGYNHDDFKHIMKTADLGIVPVVWEDNLPQVAIEYAVHGVPVLASDMGGAHELSSSKHFTFRAGDYEDYANKLSAILNDKKLLNDYFDKLKPIKTIDEHVKKLLEYYEK